MKIFAVEITTFNDINDYQLCDTKISGAFNNKENANKSAINSLIEYIENKDIDTDETINGSDDYYKNLVLNTEDTQQFINIMINKYFRGKYVDYTLNIKIISTDTDETINDHDETINDHDETINDRDDYYKNVYIDKNNDAHNDISEDNKNLIEKELNIYNNIFKEYKKNIQILKNKQNINIDV